MVQATLSRIDKKIGSLNSRKDYSRALRSEITSALIEESLVNVAELEKETRDDCDQISIEEIRKRIFDGYSYLDREGLSLCSLSALGHIVDPEKNPTRAFRGKDVTFGRGIAACSPHEVPFKADSLLFMLSREDIHPIVRAADAHLQMFAIQIFNDGNKRSARIVQNQFLASLGYPAASIPDSQSEAYLHVMREAALERTVRSSSIDEPGSASELFYKLIAGEVLRSSERLEDSLKHSHEYYVLVTKFRNRAQVMATARYLRDRCRRTGKCVSVNREDNRRKNSETLHIYGTVEPRELERVLERIAKKTQIRYDISMEV